MITPGGMYTITGKDAYQAEEIVSPRRALFLKNLNRSRTWVDPVRHVPQGYAEGYLVEKNFLAYYGFDFQGSRTIPWGKPAPTGYSVSDLASCGVETIVIDMERWKDE